MLYVIVVVVAKVHLEKIWSLSLPTAGEKYVTDADSSAWARISRSRGIKLGRDPGT